MEPFKSDPLLGEDVVEHDGLEWVSGPGVIKMMAYVAHHGEKANKRRLAMGAMNSALALAKQRGCAMSAESFKGIFSRHRTRIDVAKANEAAKLLGSYVPVEELLGLMGFRVEKQP